MGQSHWAFFKNDPSRKWRSFGLDENGIFLSLKGEVIDDFSKFFNCLISHSRSGKEGRRKLVNK